MNERMSRERWVVANWKMHGDLASNDVLLAHLRSAFDPYTSDRRTTHRPTVDAACRVGVCVPMPYLAQARDGLRGSSIVWGAQDVSAHAQGAYTGETSAAMVAEFGAQLCIVGHSERRAYHGETDAVVASKAAAVGAVGLRPVVCVGESLEAHRAGQALAVVERQARAVIDAAPQVLANALFAYEPVWAIGTGLTASPEHAQRVHAHLRALLSANDAGQVPILYGGSVKASNAAALFSMPDIDGGLIGGASRVADEFLAIVAACAAVAEA